MDLSENVSSYYGEDQSINNSECSAVELNSTHEDEMSGYDGNEETYFF